MLYNAPDASRAPYDSTQGVDSTAAGIVVFIFLIAVGYIVFRVWKSLNDEKKRGKE